MSSGDAQARFHEEWLGLAQPIEGLVFSVPVLADAQIAPVATAELSARFRELVSEVPVTVTEGGREIERTAWVGDPRRLFSDLLGYDTPGMLVQRDELPADLHFYAEEGRQDVRPSFAIARGPFTREASDPFGDFGQTEGSEEPPTGDEPAKYWALVWDLRDDGGEAARGLSLDKPEEVTGPWRYPPTAKLERLLRHTGIPIGLLCSGTELRLLYAPAAESTSHLTFRFADMVESAGRPVLAAFELLLGARRTYEAAPEHTLEGLLHESRRRQANVTKALAAQVFEAVEILLEGFEQAWMRDAPTSRIDWLRAALVEPHDHLYQGVLSVVLRLVFLLYAEDQGLLPVGSRTYAAHMSVQGLHDELQADAGMHPESMHHRFGAYGRLLSLFRAVYFGVKHGDLELPPRRGRLFDPSTFPFLEGGLPGSTAAVSDPTARAAVRPPLVDDGVIAKALERLVMFEGQRLSYRALDVEQIGAVYESLMGYHVVRLGSPAVRMGKNRVWVAAAELREKSATERKKWLKEVCGLSTAHQTKVEAALKAAKGEDALAEALSELAPGGKAERPRHRAPAGKLVLQPGDERRRSGSHYTPRSLTERIVRRTLEPVLACLGDAPTEAQILSLKVCDPAMGSGAFLVETCRHLAEKLEAVWTREGRLAGIAERHGNARLHAQRLVAQRCLYGVDKNAAAVELAKLSLWLVTMNADLPFTFLDHALRHGDSLVGLDLEQVASFHWKKAKGSQIPLFAELLKDALDQALEHRGEIHELAACEDNVCQREKRRLLDHAEHATERIRVIADACVGAFFAEGSDKAREKERARRQALVEQWLAGDEECGKEVRRLAWEIRERHAPFHWWLELPEVFYEERPDPLDEGRVNGAACMEAFVGNPPFMGGSNLARIWGTHYVNWITTSQKGTDGRADLCAHFFSRAGELVGAHGCIGFVATNTIAQGDTRRSGLARLVAHGFQVYDAVVNMPWPGAAAVVVSPCHLVNGAPARFVDELRLNGRVVGALNSSLRAATERDDPVALAANDGIAFLGVRTYGDGFVIEDEGEYQSLLHEDAANSEVLRPFLGGEDLNTDPEQKFHRWVINFGDRSLEECARWSSLLHLVRERVLPYRQGLRETALSRNLKENWWRFYSQRKDLYEALRSLERCIVTARVTKHLCFSFQRPDVIFNEKVCVIALSEYSAFGVLQSRIHDVWAWFLSSTLKTDLNYTPSDCFSTFPFPSDDLNAPIPEIHTVAQALYEERARVMFASRRGLTKFYNALKDPGETDACLPQLRNLHEALDRAVLDAYGWFDIEVPAYAGQSASERLHEEAFSASILERLYDLNAARAHQEKLRGAHAVHGSFNPSNLRRKARKK